jgi:hypothetical protein
MSRYVIHDSGTREEFPSGMVRDRREGKGRYDLISPFALRRLAGVYERGAVKYDERNWEKGAPYCRFLDSALRHIEQYLARETDEDHLAQAAWNLFAIMHFEELGRTDLDDRPKWEREVKTWEPDPMTGNVTLDSTAPCDTESHWTTPSRT